MFNDIKVKVQQQFASMDQSELLVVDLSRDQIFEAYLSAFPESERQSHNCNCCRQFLGHTGVAVQVKNGKLITAWDFELEGEYAEVPKVLRALVASAPIVGPFMTDSRKLGVDFNFQMIDGNSKRWDHFFVAGSPKLKVTARGDMGTQRGELVQTHGVFARGLQTLTNEAVSLVLDLIDNNALYRGAQYKDQLIMFKTMKSDYDKLKTPKERELYTWENFRAGGRLRNSVIGTLLVDLSEGRDLDSAVASYAQKVDPANYQRASSEVTSATVIYQGKKKLEEMGLMDSLERRHATIKDIPLDKLLFVNRDSQKVDPFSELERNTKVNVKAFKAAQECKLDQFLGEVLSNAATVELYMDNEQNVMSLLAPANEEAQPLFQWSNGLSWTYKNNMTDAIAEKVKAKGGNVDDAQSRVSLEWFNFDDLDLAVVEPNGNRIYFGSRTSSATCGFLDVDANAGCGTTRTPVENIAYRKGGKMLKGKYTVQVHNFRQREHTNIGFNLQIANGDVVQTYRYDKAVRQGERMDVATFMYDAQKGMYDLKCSLPSLSTSSLGEGLKSGTFQKVNMAMFSPNFWEENVGNKHLFFILDKARVDSELRPFFPEFLRNDLREHRKFMETLSGKMMVQPSEQQLTGVGYSLTQNHEFVAKVDNKLYRVVS